MSVKKNFLFVIIEVFVLWLYTNIKCKFKKKASSLFGKKEILAWLIVVERNKGIGIKEIKLFVMCRKIIENFGTLHHSVD